MCGGVVCADVCLLTQGSGVIKAGFAGEEYPKLHFPS